MKHIWKGLLASILVFALAGISFVYPFFNNVSSAETPDSTGRVNPVSHMGMFDFSPEEHSSEYAMIIAAPVTSQNTQFVWRLTNLLLITALAFALLLLLSVTAACPDTPVAQGIPLSSNHISRAPPQLFCSKVWRRELKIGGNLRV